MRRGVQADRLAVGGAVLAMLLVAGGGLALRGAADRARAVEPAPPTSLAVTCAPDGIAVSGREVAAGAAGVTLEVSSTLPAGSYLVSDADGYGIGEPLPDSADEWVRPIPPGDLELTCTVDGRPRPGMSTNVRVVDPSSHWRDHTLGDSGCTMSGGQPDWAVGPASGATQREAAEAAVAQMAALSGRAYSVADAALGYPDASTQTWVALTGEGTGFTIDVTRGEAGYEAGPNYLCGGLGRPPA